jgi:hypothetical protein
MFVRPFAVLFLLAALVVPAAAQETRGAIEGVIKDASGAVLPGATVEVTGVMGVVSTTADADGVFRFPSLAPGNYEVTATLSGFKPASSKVSLAVGQLLKADLSLAVGGVTETVMVTAHSSTIDVKQSSAATNIQAETIALIPKGRDFQSIVTLAPGANNESRSGGISVDGASAAEIGRALRRLQDGPYRAAVTALREHVVQAEEFERGVALKRALHVVELAVDP